MTAPATTLFVGIDIQLSRGCPVVVMDSEGRYVTSTWLEAQAGEHCGPSIADRLRGLVLGLGAHHRAAMVVGIDAPRQPLPAPRPFYWEGSARGGWRRRRPADRGLGRHCELVVSALGLARPQWTPLASAVPPWMALGFACFDAFTAGQADQSTGPDGPPAVAVHEVFPSASYRLFAQRPPQVQVSFGGFAAGPRDMLDAYCAAATVREVSGGRGWLAGGGDGLGHIALPGPRLRPDSPVHAWPTDAAVPS